MLRPSYYQGTGNPVQRHLLPHYLLPFEFPILGETSKANAKARNTTLLLIFLMDLVHSCVAFPLVGPFARELSLLFGLAFALGSRYDSGGAARTFYKILAYSICAALLMWATGKAPLVSLLALSCLLSIYTYRFGKHWIYRCTLSPLPREKATAIRDHYRRPLLILSAIPVLAAVAAIVFETFFLFSGTLLLVSLMQLCFIHDRRGALRYAKAALTSWCAYHMSEESHPGVFRSPIGTVEYRRVFLITSAVSFAYLYGYAGPTLAQTAINLVAVLFLPALFFTLTPLGILLPLLIDIVKVRHGISRTNHWSDIVDECRNSTNPVVRDSYYQGQIASDGSPLLVHEKTFEEHAHFVGPSGGGKTSKGLCPWIEQTIRRGKSSLIVVDLKADSLELLATLAAGAEELKQRTGQQLPLKVFSSMTHLPTYAFNPLGQPSWNKLEVNQKTDVICAALGLNYGTDYGAGYYSSTNAAIVYETLRLFPTIRNLTELADRCHYLIQPSTKSELHAEIKKAGVHVCEELKKLGAFEQLQVASSNIGTEPVAEQAIDLGSMFHQPQLLYVHLSSTLGASSAPTIARLFTYFLLASAATTERQCKVHLVIDEFQRMASKSVEYLLQLARSLDIGVILANQSMEDLKTLKSNLIPTIEGNCQYRQWFDVGPTEDLERIMKVSGECVEILSSSSISSNSKDSTVSFSDREQIIPRLSVNEILTAGSDKDLSIVRIGRDAGYAQYGRFPFIVRSDFHISEEEYKRRRRFTWPEPTEGMMIPNSSLSPDKDGAPSGPTISHEVDGTEDDGSNTFPGTLDDLFDARDDAPDNRRKKKSEDDSDKAEGDGDETTE